MRPTQCRVIVRFGDRWRHRIGRFRFERSGVKCCSKKPDRNLLTHRRSLRQASSRMAALKRGEGKTKGVTSGISALVEIASAVLREALAADYLAFVQLASIRLWLNECAP